MKRIVESGEVEHEQEAIVAVAAGLGFQFTPEEFDRYRAGAQDLDEEELEAVAGGDGSEPRDCGKYNYRGKWSEDERGHDRWCVTAWHCNTVTLHTEANSPYVTCWSDYRCFAISK